MAEQIKVAEPNNANTAYVGNLGNAVTEEELKALFKDCGQIKEVRIIRNFRKQPKGYVAPKKRRVIFRFAYVEFETKEAVQKAIKAVSGAKFNENVVKVDQAGEPRKIRSPNEPNPPCPTVYIGNLSYETKEEDLRKAFGPFGTLKSVRIIVNPVTGKCRGYAYIEYATAEESKNALTMNSQNLIERAIKVDYAAPPNTRVRRTRTPGQFTRGRGAPRGAPRGAATRGGRGAPRGAARENAAPRRTHEEEQLAIPLDANTVFVGNLPTEVTPQALHGALSNCGTVVNIQMATFDNRPRGFAYVHFQQEAEARRAIAQNGKVNLMGRTLRIEEARQPKDRQPRPRRAPRPEGAAPREPRPAREPRPQPAPSATLHVARVQRNMKPEEAAAALRNLFSSAGVISDVKPVVVDDKFLGYAYIVFNDVAGATNGLKINGQELEGLSLRVSYALPEAERRPPRPRVNNNRRPRGGFQRQAPAS